ncbi:Helicase associated domain protein [Streptomyces sp. NPDC003273]|uniref:Helicase associated domain protein n=2 Tax=unclassified Streptomyces TaxID=2593676 RepID=UPI00368B049B
MRDAAKAGRLEPEWTAELDALGMIWDKHDAAWRARLAAAADYHRMHGHLAAPATIPVGAWLAEQRHLATRHELATARAPASHRGPGRGRYGDRPGPSPGRRLLHPRAGRPRPAGLAARHGSDPAGGQ